MVGVPKLRLPGTEQDPVLIRVGQDDWSQPGSANKGTGVRDWQSVSPQRGEGNQNISRAIEEHADSREREDQIRLI